jgi:hypothetical protein
LSQRAPGIFALAVIAGSLAVPAAAQDPNPRAFAREGPVADAAEGPFYLFLDGPLDPERLRQRMQRPDYVLLRGEVYARLRAAETPKRPSGPPPALVEAVALGGEVGPELAQVTATFDVRLRDDAPAWVPLQLSGLVVRQAAEAGEDRPLRADATGAWEVELQGRGAHRVEVGLVVPVRRDSDGRSLEVPVPAAASTRIDLGMPAGTREVQAGGGPVVPVEEGSESHRVRLSLTPRDRVIVRWRLGSDANEAGPPLLAAQGEITIEIERGSARMRSNWSLRCERGTVEEVALRLPDSDDRIESIEVEDVALPLEGAFDASLRVLRVPLPQPLQAGESVRLGLTTRRALTEGVGSRFEFHGYPIAGALSQSGIVAIVQGQDLWVSTTPGAGLRSIDPRKELPDSLRARPATVAACRFAEQPFELTLRSEPSPPLAAVESRTTLNIERESARTDAELDYRVVRGRLSEVRISLEDGLQLIEAGPQAVVDSYQVIEEKGSRQAVVRLTPRAVAGGTFRLHLAGRQELSGPGTNRLALFEPLDQSARGGIVAIAAARDVAVQWTVPEFPAGVSPLGTDPPSDWTWPTGRPASAVQWLRLAPNVSALPLEISPRSRVVEQVTRVIAALDARRLELRQETRIQVRDGIVTRIELEVPPELEGTWEIEGDAVSMRERLGRGADGAYRYRLQLARELSDALDLRLRARVGATTEGVARKLTIPWLKVLEGTTGPVRVDVSAEPGIVLQPSGEGWAEAGPPPAGSAGAEGLPPPRLVWEGQADQAFPGLTASAATAAKLPGLLVSRLLLQSVESGDGMIRNVAWLRTERHPGAIDLRLPPRSRPLLARAGTLALTIQDLGDDRYRLLVPAGLAGPLTLRLDWQVPGRLGVAKVAPELLDGAVVEESLWEARLPSHRVLVGVPRGWSDRNRWSFDRYLWRRQPLLAPAALTAWIGLNPARDTLGDPLAAERLYLFARPGVPREPAPRVVPWPVLVGVCSGAVLVVGLAVLLARPPARLVWLCGLGASWALAVAVEPNAGLLALQAASLGLALTGVAALTRRFVDRRGRPRVAGRPSALNRGAPPAGSGSGHVPVTDPGSDESTVIRRRAPTTIDYLPTAEGVGNRPDA